MIPRRTHYAKACHKLGVMNQYERDYAAYLDSRKAAGEIISWYFESYRLILGDSCTYTPDFAVLRADDVLEFHEVKGYWMDDAKAKLRMAAAKFPHPFIAVERPRKKADREQTPWIFTPYTKEAT